MNVATHIRIVDANPSDDFVTKRSAAVKDLAGRLTRSAGVPVLLKRADEISASLAAKGKLAGSVADDTEAAIKKQSKAFVSEGHDTEMTVCAALGALSALETHKRTNSALTTTDFLAIGLWCALSFQPPLAEAKIEALRSELLLAARSFVIEAAESARKRRTVDLATMISPKEAEGNAAEAAKTLLKPVVDTLVANAAMDREEIDLLWWVLTDWSTTLGTKYSTALPYPSAIASGIEAGQRLRRLPSDAHRHLVLRRITASDDKNLSGVLKELGDKRELLASVYKDSDTIASCPQVFPLLSGLVSGEATGSGAKVSRTIEEWSLRALLESAAAHVFYNSSV